MPLYRYYFLDIDGEVHDIRAIEGRNDAAMIEHAHELLAARTKHVAIEIWRAQGFVTGVRRDGTLYDRAPVTIRRPGDPRNKGTSQ
ncbi:MAG: hypothetical protein KGQ82_08650 [Alphaproteobacteria bacterium]|nr:hypothetical protein [Alphaproteobacteria bacterium]